MTRIFTNNANNAFTTNDFAFFTNAFNTGSNFHCITYLAYFEQTKNAHKPGKRTFICLLYYFSAIFAPENSKIIGV